MGLELLLPRVPMSREGGVEWGICHCAVCRPSLAPAFLHVYPATAGAMFGFYYTYNYVKYTKTPVSNYLLGAGTIMGSALAMAVTLPAVDAAHYIGLTGCTLAVILMASPLATLKTVIQTKNTSAMPFMTSLGTRCRPTVDSTIDRVVVLVSLTSVCGCVAVWLWLRQQRCSTPRRGLATASWLPTTPSCGVPTPLASWLPVCRWVCLPSTASTPPPLPSVW